MYANYQYCDSEDVHTKASLRLRERKNVNFLSRRLSGHDNGKKQSVWLHKNENIINFYSYSTPWKKLERLL